MFKKILATMLLLTIALTSRATPVLVNSVSDITVTANDDALIFDYSNVFTEGAGDDWFQVYLYIDGVWDCTNWITNDYDAKRLTISPRAQDVGDHLIMLRAYEHDTGDELREEFTITVEEEVIVSDSTYEAITKNALIITPTGDIEIQVDVTPLTDDQSDYDLYPENLKVFIDQNDDGHISPDEEVFYDVQTATVGEVLNFTASVGHLGLDITQHVLVKVLLSAGDEPQLGEIIEFGDAKEGLIKPLTRADYIIEVAVDMAIKICAEIDKCDRELLDAQDAIAADIRTTYYKWICTRPIPTQNQSDFKAKYEALKEKCEEGYARGFVYQEDDAVRAAMIAVLVASWANGSDEPIPRHPDHENMTEAEILDEATYLYSEDVVGSFGYPDEYAAWLSEKKALRECLDGYWMIESEEYQDRIMDGNVDLDPVWDAYKALIEKLDEATVAKAALKALIELLPVPPNEPSQAQLDALVEAWREAQAALESLKEKCEQLEAALADYLAAQAE